GPGWSPESSKGVVDAPTAPFPKRQGVPLNRVTFVNLCGPRERGGALGGVEDVRKRVAAFRRRLALHRAQRELVETVAHPVAAPRGPGGGRQRPPQPVSPQVALDLREVVLDARHAAFGVQPQVLDYPPAEPDGVDGVPRRREL